MESWKANPGKSTFCDSRAQLYHLMRYAQRANAVRQSAVWVHDSRGNREISPKGFAFQPKFTPDGKKLCYRILKGASAMSDPSELRLAELNTGYNEPLLPGLPIVGRQAAKGK